MNQRTAYLNQIIEKIGGPLLDAVTAHSSKDQAISKDQAEQLAVLLSKTVQLSIALGKMIEIEKTEPELSDSLRVAMAGLAAPIVADQYRNLQKAPSDDDMSKLSNALEAVMTFSDNFSPSKENTQRLENIRASGLPVDTHQVQIQYIQAFVPVADVIARFPFGQAEKKMVQDVAEKITSKARSIRKSVFGDVSDQDTQKLYELGILKSLTMIYTQCHSTEMEKLMRLQEPDADAQTKALGSLWENFELRADMLATLAENLMPKGVKSAETVSGSVGASPIMGPRDSTESVAQPLQNPISQTPPPVQQQTSASPPAAPPPQDTQAQSSGNPMSMFSKPKAGEQQTPPPTTPPAASSPPEHPPPQTPIEQPPQENQGSQSAGGPMSFFKAPPKNEEES